MSSYKLEDALHQYDGTEQTLVIDFLQFLHSAPDVFERRCPRGHFTGSAWLVSTDGARVVLMHHRKLRRWLQPGGHADGEQDLAAVALREAQEETGLTGLTVEPAIFDLDRHRIPVRGAEPAHWHYDVRYLVRASVDESLRQNDESLALAWRPIDEIAADATLDKSLRRMADTWQQRTIGHLPGLVR